MVRPQSRCGRLPPAGYGGSIRSIRQASTSWLGRQMGCVWPLALAIAGERTRSQMMRSMSGRPRAAMMAGPGQQMARRRAHGLDDYFGTEVSVPPAVTTALCSARMSNVLHRGAVYSVAGAQLPLAINPCLCYNPP